MRLKLSLKQLFLVGLLASPVWVLIFVAMQGRLWGVGALIGQLVAFAVIILMMSMTLLSDRLAAVLYRRRTIKRAAMPVDQPVTQPMTQPMTSSLESQTSNQWTGQSSASGEVDAGKTQATESPKGDVVADDTRAGDIRDTNH